MMDAQLELEVDTPAGSGSKSCLNPYVPSSLLNAPEGYSDSDCIGFACRETAFAATAASSISFSLVNLKKKKKKTKTLKKTVTEPGEATMDGEAQTPVPHFEDVGEGMPKPSSLGLPKAKVSREPEEQFLIPHFEIVGKGMPSLLLGLPGDVYVDVSNPS